MSDGTILKVRNLSVDFPIQKSVVHAVKQVSFDLKRGETLCVVGESGSGKSVTARAILQLVAKPGAITGGQILLDTGSGEVDIVKLGSRGLAIREVRGRRIAMIFQEPMTSLSPVHTIGHQIVETILLHEKVSKEEARGGSPRPGAYSRAGKSARPLFLRIFRGHAAAGDDRHGAFVQSGNPDCRRADHGARRHDPSRNPVADPRIAARPRHGRAVHHP
jgi:ABC-type dipeptide/oligopeptide/nickel transport system ATPase component